MTQNTMLHKIQGNTQTRLFGVHDRNTARAKTGSDHTGGSCWALTSLRGKGREPSYQMDKEQTIATSNSRELGGQEDKDHCCRDQKRQRIVQVIA
jgi:hypothetical protein